MRRLETKKRWWSAVRNKTEAVVGVDLVSDVAVGWNGDGRLGLRDRVFFLTEKNMWIAISLLFPFFI
jgi:hypothetical protein